MYQERAFELHTHLYGCLREDELRWLASRKEPRWHIFSNTFEKTYGKPPDLENIFSPSRKEDLRKYSVYESVGNFPQFQCCFDFVISVAHADEQEVYDVARRLSKRQTEPYAEYRMLFGPQLEMEDYRRRIVSLCEGFHSAQNDSYLVMSLWRGGDLAAKQYETLLQLMDDYPVVRQRLVGVDFCAQEEGYPPEDKADLFQSILSNNREYPDKALSILYHVGESFQDKSVESAVRWIYESARLGAHRLGHCIALGQDPREFLGTVRKESLSERIHQLEFELEHGLAVSHPNEDEIRNELEELRQSSLDWQARASARTAGVEQSGEVSSSEERYTEGPAGKEGNSAFADDSIYGTEPQIAVHYTPDHVDRLKSFQDRLMEKLKEMQVVIEVCPTSNHRIGAVTRHPVHRFLENDLSIVVGADDPGIFDTDLETEFQILSSDGIKQQKLEEMVERSRISHSAALSGRKS